MLGLSKKDKCFHSFTSVWNQKLLNSVVLHKKVEQRPFPSKKFTFRTVSCFLPLLLTVITLELLLLDLSCSPRIDFLDPRDFFLCCLLAGRPMTFRYFTEVLHGEHGVGAWSQHQRQPPPSLGVLGVDACNCQCLGHNLSYKDAARLSSWCPPQKAHIQ